eukprot:GHVU01150561.1.p3 GENE.GHVU01150561.1~~GHVU01150561.1.p3  ORF type:complete len:102 (-),score=5.10 GHVU01150561.1:3412-3717(-)
MARHAHHDIVLMHTHSRMCACLPSGIKIESRITQKATLRYVHRYTHGFGLDKLCRGCKFICRLRSCAAGGHLFDFMKLEAHPVVVVRAKQLPMHSSIADGA